MHGTLPAPGTVCQTDTQIFQNPGNSSVVGGVTFPKGSVFNPRETFELERPGDFEAAVKGIRESGFLLRNAFTKRFPRRAPWRG